MYIKKTLLFLQFYFTLSVNAQTLIGSFVAYGAENKHFANVNYAVFQSKNGYLWFGTSNGVVRFDGKNYKNFFSNYIDSNSPSDNIIVSFAEDKNDHLWMAGFLHGVTRYNPTTGQFKKYSRLSKDNSIYYGINSILCDKDQELWFATSGRGLAKYNYTTDSFDLYYPEPEKTKDGSKKGDNHLTDICQDKNDKNILWCTSFNGLFAFNKAKKEFTKYRTYTDKHVEQDILFTDVEYGNNNTLWLSSYGKGLIEFNVVVKQFKTATTSSSMPLIINDVKKISDSILYLACFDKGLIKFNITSKQVEDITPMSSNSLEKKMYPGIQKISITKDAGIFIGGKHNIYQQHPAFERLKTNVFYKGKHTNEDIFLSGIIWDSYRKKYWLTTIYGNGVYEMYDETKKAIPVKVDDNKKGIGIENYKCPIIDAKKRIWVVKNKDGISLYNDEKKSFSSNTTQWPVPDSLVNYTTHLATDAKGNIWALAKSYFIYCDVLKKNIEVFPLQFDKSFRGKKSITNPQLTAGLNDDVFLFTDNGVFNCNRISKKVIHIFKTGESKDSLASYTVRAATVNRYNALWISNGSNLQVVHSTKFNVLANHDIDHGLPSMSINYLNSDTLGKIWANTGRGLAMFNPKAKYWKLYNRFDGMEKDYLDVASFLTTNNKIVIDQQNGFILKDINEVVSTTQPPYLRISSLSINDKFIPDTVNYENIKQLNLSYKENNITIEFAAMDWLYPMQTNYVYWVEGLQLAKTPRQSDSKINLYGLASGKYVVHLKALNNSGVWSNEVILSITINPPFWKRWWFVLLCTLTGLGLIYIFYKYRLQQINKVQLIRNTISRNLHDDIGASLSNINILTELAKRNAENPKKSTDYLNKVGEDIQYISQNLSDIVWNISPNYDNIESLFIRMKRYAADMLDGKDIVYDISFPEKIDDIKLDMEKRKELYFIYKEAINNITKHSFATKASVSLTIAKQKIYLQIIDNGIGFDALTISNGNGLQNIKHRASKLNAQLKIESNKKEGTTLLLSIPI